VIATLLAVAGALAGWTVHRWLRRRRNGRGVLMEAAHMNPQLHPRPLTAARPPKEREGGDRFGGGAPAGWAPYLPTRSGPGGFASPAAAAGAIKAPSGTKTSVGGVSGRYSGGISPPPERGTKPPKPGP